MAEKTVKHFFVSSPFSQMQTRLSQLFSAPLPIASEYQSWRSRFILERLQITLWIALLTLLAVTLLLPHLLISPANSSHRFTSTNETLDSVAMLIAQGLGLVLGLLLQRYKTAHRYPQVLFLIPSWSLLILPLMIAGWTPAPTAIDFDVEVWIVLFAAQAILMPVYWQLHLISQVGVIIYFIGVVLWTGNSVYLNHPSPTIDYVTGGFILFCVCFIADLGVYLYERLLKREFELRQHLRVFIHAVSHDLRVPAQGMAVLLKAFQCPTATVELPSEVLQQMIDSSERQVQLINLLLEAHQAEVQGIPVHCQALLLEPLIQSILAELQPMLKQLQATVTSSISTQLPAVTADALQLRRVYENLIMNAVKHNRPGLQITLKAQVASEINPQSRHRRKLQGDRRWLYCTVQDDGVGLSPQQCQHIFDLYVRSSSRQSLGLGLGLYICRQIVEAHGGQIGVISRLGEGATFWFTLPLWGCNSANLTILNNLNLRS